jgi:hypothetical protein
MTRCNGIIGPGDETRHGRRGSASPRPSDACGLFWRVPVSGAETSGAQLRSGSLRKDHHTLVEEGPPTIRRRVNHPQACYASSISVAGYRTPHVRTDHTLVAPTFWVDPFNRARHCGDASAARRALAHAPTRILLGWDAGVALVRNLHCRPSSGGLITGPNYLRRSSPAGAIPEEKAPNPRAAVKPEAVLRGADGYLRVDYARLGLRLQTWDQWTAAH